MDSFKTLRNKEIMKIFTQKSDSIIYTKKSNVPKNLQKNIESASLISSKWRHKNSIGNYLAIKSIDDENLYQKSC